MCKPALEDREHFVAGLAGGAHDEDIAEPRLVRPVQPGEPRRHGVIGPRGDGYVVGIASNYAEMASELHIVDAQRMEEGAVAVVKLPLRLRSGDGEVVAAVAAADLQFVPA